MTVLGPLMVQLAVPLPPPLQSSVEPLTTQPPEGRMMLVICACAPEPRMRPHAADAAHNQVRKRIMSLSLP
jgi:hypothetical protein